MARRRSTSINYETHKSPNDHRRQKESITELKHVYTSIKYDWPQVLDGNTSPIEMAISLLDDTSVGLAHRKHEFERLSEETREALRNVVNENHEIFNNSIGSYHVLLSTLDDSKNDSAQIKEMLESSTRDIQDRSDVLNDLDQTSMRYAEMIEILDAMEELNSIPQKIEQLIVDKKIHQIYDVISNGYQLAAKYNLWSISAMQSNKNFLDLQSNNLYDMIVEELQNEIYLKNTTLVDSTDGSNPDRHFFSWQSLVQSTNPQLSSFRTLVTLSNNLEQYIYNSANLDIFEVSDAFSETAINFVQLQLPKIHNHYSNTDNEIDYSILLEANLNSNSESFHYIYRLLSTAHKLNRLQSVLAVLLGTHQQELHGLINRTTEECKSKNIAQLNKLSKIQNFEYSITTDIIGGNTFNDASVSILSNLFGSIFIKCLIVLQKHKIVSNIVDKIESSQSLPGVSGARTSYMRETGVYSFKSIWDIVRKELQSLMINYIYDNHAPVFNTVESLSSQHNDLHEILAKKQVFKFEDVSSHSVKATEDMTNVLSNMFPGFSISDSKNKEGLSVLELDTPYIKNETFNAMVEVLVPKNIFNMRIILEFFLIFTAGSQRLFLNFADEPQEGQEFDQSSLFFFRSFMRESFLSKIDQTLDQSFKEFVEDEDAAGDGSVVVHTRHTPRAGALYGGGLKCELIPLDSAIQSSSNIININSSNHSAAKIYRNALDFKRVFVNACSTLNTSLTYREDISSTVLKFLKKFSNAYNNFYKELLSQEELTVYDQLTSANGTGSSTKPLLMLQKWLGNTALTEMSSLILQQRSNPDDLDALINKEVEIMLFNTESKTSIFNISKDDFLDDDSFNQVCYLFLTTSWILKWLPSMRKESNYAIYNDNTDTVRLSTIDKLKHDWSFLENGRSNYTALDETQHVYLALNSDKINEFQDIIENFMMIRDKTLLALRYDLRVKAVYFLGKSFKETDWLPTTEPGDSDQCIGQYNKEVFSVDNRLNNVLDDLEREGVFVGLANFINKLLIQGSEIVKKINNNGIKRVVLNIFTLQQMLKSILNTPERINFTKASRYFELFTLKEQIFIGELKKNELQFSRGEFLNLARLVYSEKLADGNGSAFNKSKHKDLVEKINSAFN